MQGPLLERPGSELPQEHQGAISMWHASNMPTIETSPVLGLSGRSLQASLAASSRHYDTFCSTVPVVCSGAEPVTDYKPHGK
jgi:hypothetical protein